MTVALYTDGYKTFHESAIHEDIVRMYGNFTNRHNRLSNLPDNKLNGVAFLGLQYACIGTLINGWNDTFFNIDKAEVISEIKRILDAYLATDYNTSHYEELHDLGYLPIQIKALPEGTLVPYGMASFTIQTTVDGFQWLALYLETILSTEIWGMSTSMTTASYYMLQSRQMFKNAKLSTDLIPFINHDFSMRGMFGKQAGAMSGFGHLAAGHCGTDTIPAMMFAEKYYGANISNELVGASVKASEHSITTSFIMTYAQEHNVSKFEAEVEYARMLLKENPTGILSYVADSFDFWRFITEGLKLLKDDIMTRDGTFVIRPDSGNPVDIICGVEVTSVNRHNINNQEELNDLLLGWFNDEYANGGFDEFDKNIKQYIEWDGDVYSVICKDVKVDNHGAFDEDENTLEFSKIDLTAAERGAVQNIFDEFGGTETDSGYKMLDSHVGLIYGDAITVQRQDETGKRLMNKNFSPSVVLGVGSYSYQYVTRDTHGSAIKCTAAFLKDGTIIDVHKDPKTDSKKKSAKGLLRIERVDGELVQYDQQTIEEERQGLLETVFLNSKMVKSTSLSEIRQRITEQLDKLID